MFEKKNKLDVKAMSCQLLLEMLKDCFWGIINWGADLRNLQNCKVNRYCFFIMSYS